MTTLIWITIALVVTANVAVVSWTQTAIWRRLDRIEQTQQADHDALHADTTLLRAQTARTLATLNATLPDNPDNHHTDPEHPND